MRLRMARSRASFCWSILICWLIPAKGPPSIKDALCVGSCMPTSTTKATIAEQPRTNHGCGERVGGGLSHFRKMHVVKSEFPWLERTSAEGIWQNDCSPQPGLFRRAISRAICPRASTHTPNISPALPCALFSPVYDHLPPFRCCSPKMCHLR